MKYAVEMDSGAVINIPSFIKIGSGIQTLSKGCNLDVVGGPSTPHDPESDPGGSLRSWQGHPSR
jgi:hypothetical protein